MKRRMQDYQDTNIQEMERVLRQASEMLPKPQKEIPVSAARKTDNERHRFGRTFRRVAVAMLSVVLLGGSTVVAASPVLRQTVIRFFTQGAEEKVPYDMHLATKQMDDKDHHSDILKTAKTSEEAQTTVGAVTLLQDQVLDEHFTASYLVSSDYLNVFLHLQEKCCFIPKMKQRAIERIISLQMAHCSLLRRRLICGRGGFLLEICLES